MPVAYLGLGSNLDAGQNLQLAFRELRSRFSLLKMSMVYCNEALGFDGADFPECGCLYRNQVDTATAVRRTGAYP